MTEYSPTKTGEYPRIFPNFHNCVHCEKDLKDNKDNSRNLAQKYARIFVLGHYLFLVAHSFPRAQLEENCSLLRTDNVCGQISKHIFAPNGGYCLYYPILQIFFVMRAVLKIGEYSRIFPSFSWGIFGHVTSLDQSCTSKKIWWILKVNIENIYMRWSLGLKIC